MTRFARRYPVTTTYTAVVVTIILVLLLGQLLGGWGSQ